MYTYIHTYITYTHTHTPIYILLPLLTYIIPLGTNLTIVVSSIGPWLNTLLTHSSLLTPHFRILPIGNEVFKRRAYGLTKGLLYPSMDLSANLHLLPRYKAPHKSQFNNTYKFPSHCLLQIYFYIANLPHHSLPSNSVMPHAHTHPMPC